MYPIGHQLVPIGHISNGNEMVPIGTNWWPIGHISNGTSLEPFGKVFNKSNGFSHWNHLVISNGIFYWAAGLPFEDPFEVHAFHSQNNKLNRELFLLFYSASIYIFISTYLPTLDINYTWTLLFGQHHIDEAIAIRIKNRIKM